jgi:DNA-binding transcriptional MerR regulator
LYKTSQIAKLIGVHPNTIRFYEEMKLLPVIPRAANGYRIFDDKHVEQLRLLRTAFHVEIMSNCLRMEAINIIKAAAAGNLEDALKASRNYYSHLKEEKGNAEVAIRITLDIIENNKMNLETDTFTGRSEMAKRLGITIDVLRDWERNGLIQVPSDNRGWRIYGTREIKRLKIIRTLRNANYSMMAILRMLRQLDKGSMKLKEAIDTPEEEEDIVCAADRYISSLNAAEHDALEMIDIIAHMIEING